MVSALNNRPCILGGASVNRTPPFQATTTFDIRGSANRQVWSVAGRGIPAGNIASIDSSGAHTVFTTSPGGRELKASVDEDTGMRRRYGLENARAGRDYPTDVPPRHGAMLVDLNAVDSRGEPLPGQLRVRVADIQQLTQAVAGTDYPQLSPPAPGVPMPFIDRDYVVVVTNSDRIRL